MSAAHTPGPWNTQGRHKTEAPGPAGTHVIVDTAAYLKIDGPESLAALQADAHLIAAAPELFWACLAQMRRIHERASDAARYCLSAVDDAEPYLNTSDEVVEYRALRAAIAKARGL